MGLIIDNVLRWFRGPTDREMYERGREVVDTALSIPMDESVAEYLFSLSDGCFNETPGQKSFDKGVQDRLHELSFESPY